jgi:nitrogen fixation/metabolism regulation signal transduction histidine kinase
MKHMSLKIKMFILLLVIVLLAALPLFVYYMKAARGLADLGMDRDIEQSLNRTLELAKTPADREHAVLAIKKYRQIKVLKESIVSQVLIFSLAYFTVVMIIAIVLGYVFISRITRPLAELTEATRKLARDNLTESLHEAGGGEIGQLVSAFNKMIRDLRVAREQQAIAERRATWQRVARTIAHEIKNPLTPIKLSTERMVDKFMNQSRDFPEVIKSTSQTILQEIDNLQKMVDTFHKYAKFPDPVFRPEQINAIVSDVLAMFPGNGKIEVSSELAEGVPEMALDSGQMREALVNLVKNAIQAVEEAGRPGRIKVTVKNEDDRVLLSVADNGCGISDENKKRLFQPYFTTKKHGSGIGLALTERIVSLNGGEILCESEAGRGTTFTLIFNKTTTPKEGAL